MAAAYQNQDKQILEESGLEIIGKLQVLVEQIETQIGQPHVLHGRSLKMLLAEPRIILNIIKEEYHAAPGAQQRKMLCCLEDRMKDFDETLIDCNRFLEILSGRGMIWAIFFRKHDLRMIKAHHEEVKKRGEEIERGITRLKTHWSDHIPPPQAAVGPSGVWQERQPDSSTTIPTLVPTGQPASDRAQPVAVGLNLSPTIPPTIIPAPQQVAPTTSLSHATVRDSAFHSVGNDMHSTAVNDYSRWEEVGNTIVNGNMYVLHFHSEGRESRNN